MAKTDKNHKRGTSNKTDPVKEKPAVPASSKEILAKAAALAKPTSKAPANGKKIPSASSASSSDSSSVEESSNGESESSEETFPLKKADPILSEASAVKKAADPSDDSSSSSSAEGSDGESDSSEEAFQLKKTDPVLSNTSVVKKAVDPSGDSSSSEESSSAESDGESDSSEEASPLKKPDHTLSSALEVVKKAADLSDDSSSSEESSSEGGDNDKEMASVPAKTSSAEVNKKRKADSEAAALPKKVKLATSSSNISTSGEEIKSIFVGRLSWNVDNDWLAQEFAECGEVESAHVQMDRNTGRSRGFGYVHFKTADAVEKAIALNGKEIDGRAINVDRSNPPDKKTSMEKRKQAFGDVSSPPTAVLFVGNLSFGVNEDTLWETFGEHGDVKSVRVPTDRDTGRPKGFAYVEFSQVGAAKGAHEALQGFELDGRSLRLDFSQPRDSAGGRGGGQGGRGGRGRGGFGGDRGRGGGRGGRGGDRGRGGRGRGARTGGITHFEGQKITFD